MLAPSASAQSTGGCQLQGTASFAPGLNNSAQDFSYSFNGTLSGCQSSQFAAPTSGAVSAGELVTINGEQFSGAAGVRQRRLLQLHDRRDGDRDVERRNADVVDYSTTAVHLQGNVVASVTLPAISPQPGQPTSTTVTTTRYVGASALGLLAFEPPDPTACKYDGGSHIRRDQRRHRSQRPIGQGAR